ncbi:MAG TPA: hypothetical protein V6C71_22840, partial [Coleofasciculaceae cyanobacterium]
MWNQTRIGSETSLTFSTPRLDAPSLKILTKGIQSRWMPLVSQLTQSQALSLRLLGVEPRIAPRHSHSKPCLRLSPHTATPGSFGTIFRSYSSHTRPPWK